ncbi:hypothetical protein DL769_002628 [Monosporascus sp. CRB-8-3]|nr:hypothetical protein DL769_002628 [Monosporascus sp. CRB-8-3]
MVKLHNRKGPVPLGLGPKAGPSEPAARARALRYSGHGDSNRGSQFGSFRANLDRRLRLLRERCAERYADNAVPGAEEDTAEQRGTLDFGRPTKKRGRDEMETEDEMDMESIRDALAAIETGQLSRAKEAEGAGSGFWPSLRDSKLREGARRASRRDNH